MNKLVMEDFLSSNRGGNVVNFDKNDFINFVNPDQLQVHYSEAGNKWFISIINSETKRSFRMGLHEDLKPTAAIQKLIDQGNTAAAALKLDPKDTKAQAVVTKVSPQITAWAAEVLDAEENYIYAGESENGKWIRISPNAPGTMGDILTLSYSKVAA